MFWFWCVMMLEVATQIVGSIERLWANRAYWLRRSSRASLILFFEESLLLYIDKNCTPCFFWRKCVCATAAILGCDLYRNMQWELHATWNDHAKGRQERIVWAVVSSELSHLLFSWPFYVAPICVTEENAPTSPEMRIGEWRTRFDIHVNKSNSIRRRENRRWILF